MATTTQPYRFKWEQAFRRDAVKSGVPPRAMGTGLLMASYGNSDGSSIKVSHRRLAANLGVTERTVRRSISDLTGSGWIREVSTYTAPGQTVEYRLSIVEVEDGNTGHQCPPLEGNTGHQCPTNTGHECPPLGIEHRTLVTRTPDTGDQNTGHSWQEHRTPVSAYHKDTMSNHGVYQEAKESETQDAQKGKPRDDSRWGRKPPMPTDNPAEGMEWFYSDRKRKWIEVLTFDT